MINFPKIIEDFPKIKEIENSMKLSILIITLYKNQKIELYNYPFLLMIQF